MLKGTQFLQFREETLHVGLMADLASGHRDWDCPDDYGSHRFRGSWCCSCDLLQARAQLSHDSIQHRFRLSEQPKCPR